MSTTESQAIRQWVSAPGGSCDVRAGAGVIESCGRSLATLVGKPRLCALVSTPEVDEDLVERLRRQLTDGGFEVRKVTVAAGPDSRTLEAQATLLNDLREAHVTADDLVMAVGDVDALSAACNASALWCGGVPFVAVALDLEAMLEVALTPRGLAVAADDDMVSCGAFCRVLLCDADAMDLDLASERTRHGLAIMAATAMAENENTFSRLWDCADEIAAGEKSVLLEEAVDILKARGRLASSTAIAVRQSLGFGQTFVRALSRLVPEAERSVLLAEALRFSARLSAGMGQLSVDDVLAQDELLETLGLGELAADVEPEAMVDALKSERFLRTNRFLLALPQVIGRVRLSSVPDDLLAEHAGAFCDAHRAS